MSNFPYTLDDDTGARRTLGLIVLQVDETIETEFRQLFRDKHVALYVSRIPSGADLTPETIARMEAELPHAASLLPQTPQYDAVGYACTSGTTLIGAEQVAKLVAGSCRTRLVTDPLSAAINAFRALGVSSVGLVTPYIAPVAEPVLRAIEREGVTVPASLSFGERSEANVARIDAASVRAAALEVARGREVEAVFLSCTNLRTLGLIADLEAELGLPVLSSNLALGWRMARAAGLTGGGPGRLFATQAGAAPE